AGWWAGKPWASAFAKTAPQSPVTPPASCRTSFWIKARRRTKKGGYPEGNRRRPCEPCTLKIRNSGAPVTAFLRVIVDEYTYPGEETNQKADSKQAGKHSVINKHRGHLRIRV